MKLTKEKISNNLAEELNRETSSSKKNTQSELLSTEPLKNVLFPDVISNIKKISIEATKPWDNQDIDLFSYLCKKSSLQTINNKDVLFIEGNLFELCSVLFPGCEGSYGAKQYQLAQNRLENLFNTTISAVFSDGIVEQKHLFDSLEIDTKKEDHEQFNNSVCFRITFGRAVTEDIFAHRISTIIKPQYDELENPVSKMLYVQLKKDRLIDLYSRERKKNQNGKITVIDKPVGRDYSLINLILTFHVKEARKPARIARYKEALTEMKEKGILVQDFRVSGDNFYVEWLPLSAEESLDIKMLRE